MQIKINCNQLINLDNFLELSSISIDVLSYKLNNDTLEGDVKIGGFYQKNNNSKLLEQGFEEIVPFTLVFRSKNIQIDLISIENKEYHSFNTGIDVSFELVVDYSIVEENKPNIEEDIQIPVIINEEIETKSDIKISEIKENEIDNLSSDVENDISKKYDEILDNLINTRTKDIHDNKKIKIKDKDKLSKVVVYYISKESDVEKIAKIAKTGVNEIYTKNKDLLSSKRIVINE